MTYYNPFLAAWFQGATGRELARLSTQLTLQLNQILREVTHRPGPQSRRWRSASRPPTSARRWSCPGSARVPLNVARICQWTWTCTHGDIHANAAGYAVIADAFDLVVDV